MEIVPDQKITTKLSLAVSLIDDFTGEEIFGIVKVRIPELNYEASKNPSGYFNFSDLPDGMYSLEIKSDYYIENVIENLKIPRIFSYQFLTSTGAPAGSTEAVLTDSSGLLNGDVVEFNNGINSERRTIMVDPDPLINNIYWEDDPLGGLTFNYSDSDSITIPIPERLVVRMELVPDNTYPFPVGTTLLRGNVFQIGGTPIAEALIELSVINFKTKTSSMGTFLVYFPPTQQDALFDITVTPDGEIPKTVSSEVKKGKDMSLTIEYP